MFDMLNSIADLFARHPLADAAVAFLPAWLLALFAGIKSSPSMMRASFGRLSTSAIRGEGTEGLTLLPLLLWAGIAAFRSNSFFEKLAWSHGPEFREFYVIAAGNIGAGAVTCCLITGALAVRRQPAARLGLRGWQYFVSIALILGTLLDTIFLLAVHTFFQHGSSAGIPLPMTLVQ